MYGIFTNIGPKHHPVMEENIPNMEHLGIVSTEADKQDISPNPLQHTETNIQSPMDPTAAILASRSAWSL